MSLQNTDLNMTPYFDDFDESKNFHRILFRPRSVQARELTQAQTILQSQIDRLGRHLFEEGSVVIPGGIRYKIDQDVASVSFTGTISPDQVNNNIGQLYLKSKATAMEALILKYKPAVGNVPAAIAIDYSRAVGSTLKFADGEPCAIVSRDSAGVDTELANAAVVTTGKCIMVYLKAGVYFVRGHLVATKDQAILAANNNQESIRVGLVVKETIIDENADPSLLSNAAGTPNYKAPGASRLKFDLILSSKNQADNPDPNMIELLKFTNGQLEKRVDQTEYAQLAKTLAQRTYEESGDYAVNDFSLTPYNHLLNATNTDGLFTAAQGGDDNKLVFRLGPGIGYVKGFRTEINGFYDVIVDKTRDTEIVNNGVMGADFGSYFVVQNATSIPFIDIKTRINFLDATGTIVVGSFLVRSLKRESSTKLRFYVMDMRFNASYTLADAKKIKYQDGSNLITGDIVASVIFSGTNDSLLFRLPYDSIKSLKGAGSISDTSYSVVRNYDVALNSSGVGSVTLPAGELFGAVNEYDYMVALTGASTAGTFFTTTTLSLSGSPIGKVLNVNLGAPGANKSARVIAKVIKQNPQPKSKTLRTQTETLTFSNETKKTLAKADIYRIVSVTNLQNSAVETSAFTFYDGQRQNWYESGQLISSTPLTGQWSVTYEWFDHSIGDYFVVDSYGGMARELIPFSKETADRQSVSLADCIDFRPLKASSGDFTLATFAGDIVDPTDNIRFDLTHYLPRIDLVYASSDGSFQAVKGTPSMEPIAPSVPDNGMPLYEVFIPAYVLKGNQVKVKSFDNRRYTMRDIGKIDRRLTNVEYYTALNLLETKADRYNVIDATTGTSRFKNGFAVDGFKSSAMADLADPDWLATMDIVNGRLKADFVANASDMVLDTSVDISGAELVSKGFTHSKFVSQPYMTGVYNVNPYLVVAWTGTVKITPSSDFWKDIQYVGPTLINKVSDFIDTTDPTSNDTAFWVKVNLQTTVSNTVDNLITSVPINKIRARDLTFTLTGFKPYSRVYPFFNSSPVSEFCKPTGGNYNDPIVCDDKGAASGIFSIPDNDTKSFPTGAIVFRFTDSATDNRELVTTEGEAIYTAQGETESRQKITTETTTIRRVWQQRRNYDPIAQTFRVTEAGGCFFSKVDIFFNKKARVLPITLQVRTVRDGLPTNDVLPLSEVRLNPSAVNADTTGVTPTTFTFSDPIYLQEGLEYAIVLLTDSAEYEVFISTMGSKMLDKNEMVSKQPNLGVFLSSSNASTWTPHQLDDLKFNLYKAQFALTDSTAIFKNAVNPVRVVSFNALTSTVGSTTVRVNLKSHGLKTGDTATLNGVVSGNGIVASQINGIAKSVTNYDLDWFEISVTTAATLTGTFGGGSMTCLTNYPFTEVESYINQMVVAGTSISWEIRYVIQATRSLSEWIPLQENTFQKLLDEGVGYLGSIELRATLKTKNANLTPQIDKTAFGLSLLGRRINSNASAPVYSYVTKSLKFDNPSTASRIFVSGILPNGTSMKVYYKLLTTGDEPTINKPWVEVLPLSPLANSNKVMEYEYSISGVGTFGGYKLRVVFLGTDRAQTPELESITTIALA